MLTVEEFRHPLEGLEAFVGQTAGLLGGRAAVLADGGDIFLTGPVPCFTADPRAVARGDPVTLKAAGWRALARFEDRPIMVIDIIIQQDRALYSVRGDEAADAMDRVMAAAKRLSDAPEVYTVCWLSLPDIYVSGLWLISENPLFIPTRFGSGRRSEPTLMSETEMREQVRVLVEEASRRPPGVGLFESLVFEETPRSGLPDDPA